MSSVSLSSATDRGRTLKYTAVACVGFVADWLLLKLGIALGLPPWGARAISLTCAMQVTFALNRQFVFSCPDQGSLPVQWACYMATNALGNLCNYLAFTTLLSLHRPLLSNPLFALVVGGVTAWTINYLSARHLVFASGPDSLMGRLRALSGADPAACRPDPAAVPNVPTRTWRKS